MARGGKIALAAGLLALGTAGTGVLVFQEEIAARWRYLTVKGLRDPARRERVFREVVGWQRYRGTPRYKVDPPDADEEIERVIECPQKGRLPMFAVVFRDDIDFEEQHFELVDFDGTLIPAYENTSRWDFRDVNGDGVLERAELMRWGFELESEVSFLIEVFTLISMTPEQEIRLCVAFCPASLQEKWGWQIRDSSGVPFPEIVIGPEHPTTRVILPRAVYRWDPSRSQYTGPDGGVDEDFLRVEGEDVDALGAFAVRRGLPDDDQEE